MPNLTATLLADLPALVNIIKQGPAFEAGEPVTIPVPAESYELDLTAEGVGKVKVSESGTTLTLQKG